MYKTLLYLLLCAGVTACATPEAAPLIVDSETSTNITERVKTYLSKCCESDDITERVTLSEPVAFTLFKNNGHLVCVTPNDNESLFYYPGPYAVMVLESNLFNTGGGEYLCSMDSVSGSGNSEYKAIKTPHPDFPVSFFEEKKSGYVITEFTIAEDGSTTNIHVHKTDLSDVFIERALETVALYKYQPRIINGIPRKVHGVRARFNFERYKKK